MILFHRTSETAYREIVKNGLRPNKIGIVYLSPQPEAFTDGKDPKYSVLLQVETGDLRLTAFDDCSDWEVLCWGHVPPENITKYT